MKIALQLCYAVVCAALLPMMTGDHADSFSGTIGCGVMAVVLFFFLYWVDKQSYDKRMNILTHVLGLFFSAMTAFGWHLELQGSIPYTDLRLAVAILLYAHMFSKGLCVLWKWLIRWETHLAGKVSRDGKRKGFENLLQNLLEHPLLIMALLLICWMPCYLSTFPGNFYHDATDEFLQMTTGYRGDFPMLHSAVINYVLKAAELLTESYNAGIAFYTICQMVLLALLYGYMIRQFYEIGVNRNLLGVLLAYMALFPLIHVLVTSTVRDVMFSGLLLYVVLQTYLLGNDPAAFFGKIHRPIILGITTALTLLSRNNSAGILVMAVLSTVAVCFFFGFGKKNRKGTAVFGASLIGGYLLIHLLLTWICQPYQPADLSGSLSIMTQPIARAYFYENENWTQDQKTRFAEYFAVDEIEYVPENADSTKGNCLVDKNTMIPFVRFWISMGIRYPDHYLDAILANTMQMWFPGSVVDGYVESGDWPAYEKSFYFFLSEIEAPGKHMHLLPGVQAFYEALGSKITYEKIPVISMLFSIGFHFWFLLNGIFYSIYRRSRHLYLPLGLLFVYTMLSALVPLVCLRYFAALFLAFPMVLVMTLQPNMKK